jgi:two-component system chemotaxis response regulator CheY
MSGIDFARAVRTTDTVVPILMVTTRSAREDIMAAVSVGVNNYVLKPFTPQVLKEKIDQVLQAAA